VAGAPVSVPTAASPLIARPHLLVIYIPMPKLNLTNEEHAAVAALVRHPRPRPAAIDIEVFG